MSARRPRRGRLARHILLWVMPVSAGFMLAAMLLVSQVMGGAVRRYAHDANRKAADIAALRVEVLMGDARGALTRVARQIPADADTTSLERTLRREVQSSDSLYLLILVGENGRERASSEPLRTDRSGPLEQCRRQALDGRFAQSRVRNSGGSVPYLEMCAPVKRGGRVRGALCGRVDFRAVWRVLDRAGEGKTGFAELIGPDGVYLAHPDKSAVFKHRKAPAAQWKQMREPRGSFTGRDAGRKRVLMAFATLSDFGWKVLVAQDYDEALARYIRVRNLLFAAAAGMLVLVGAAVAAVARRIARPVEDLTAAAGAVAGGDLSPRIPVRRGDELGDLAAAFNHMVERLELNRDILIHTERLGAVGRFAAGVAHEVKNPVSGLLGYTYLLKSNPAPEQVAEFAADMEAELQNISAILERLLDSARRREARFEDMDLNHAARGAVKLLEHHLGSSANVRLVPGLDPDPIPLHGDARLLQQAAVNLVLNAAAAVSPGGEVRIRTERRNGRALLTVSDNGPGMDAGEAARIFEPFYSGKTGPADTGTGLGLYVVREIATLHHGTISVRTAPGQGAAFTLDLPARAGNGDA